MNPTNTNITNNQSAVTAEETLDDFKNAGLVVSITVNLFIFSAWLVLELTDAFNAQIISYLQK